MRKVSVQGTAGDGGRHDTDLLGRSSPAETEAVESDPGDHRISQANQLPAATRKKVTGGAGTPTGRTQKGLFVLIIAQKVSKGYGKEASHKQS